MFHIKLEKDESLIITTREAIFRNENLNGKIIYLIPSMIDDVDISDSRVYLNYIRADGIPNVVELEDVGMKYSENYHQYTFPIDCKITSVAGDVCTWLHFISSSSEKIVAKSGECTLTIQDTKDIGDYDEDGIVLPDLQDRVAFAENSIGELKQSSHEHKNADILSKITGEDIVAWGLSEQNAKNYADSIVEMHNDVFAMLWAEVARNANNISALKAGPNIRDSIEYKIAQAFATIIENPDETMNSINELVQWIDGHAEDALALSNDVDATKKAISAIGDLVGSTPVGRQISTAITEALTQDGTDKYALVETLRNSMEEVLSNAQKYTDDRLKIYSGMYCGEDEPTDQSVIIWVNPNGEGDDVIGDIDLALSNIIEIQESYIFRATVPIDMGASE